jgi:hypothetical protein
MEPLNMRTLPNGRLHASASILQYEARTIERRFSPDKRASDGFATDRDGKNGEEQANW